MVGFISYQFASILKGRSTLLEYYLDRGLSPAFNSLNSRKDNLLAFLMEFLSLLMNFGL